MPVRLPHTVLNRSRCLHMSLSHHHCHSAFPRCPRCVHGLTELPVSQYVAVSVYLHARNCTAFDWKRALSTTISSNSLLWAHTYTKVNASASPRWTAGLGPVEGLPETRTGGIEPENLPVAPYVTVLHSTYGSPSLQSCQCPNTQHTVICVYLHTALHAYTPHAEPCG